MYPDVLHFIYIYIYIYIYITKFSRSQLHDALPGCDITFVLAMGGSPCQGVSGVNAGRAGFADPRTQLLFHMLRVFTDLTDEKHRVHYCAENVASMSEKDKAEFSRLLRVKPVRVCSKGLCQSRRPRYVWACWAIPQGPRLTLEGWPIIFQSIWMRFLSCFARRMSLESSLVHPIL